jgi:hypothetical protein
MLNKKALAGTPSTPPAFVEDVFSTYLYTANAASQTITNGIDLAGKGGLVWTKSRSLGYQHNLYDTARGVNNYLTSNSTSAALTGSPTLTNFNSNGFTLGVNDDSNYTSGSTSCSWTFREQPKFFDIVTYTGNGAGSRTISHSLGSAPGMIIIKNTSGTADWAIWHRGNGTTWRSDLSLNTTGASANSGTTYSQTSTEIQLSQITTAGGSGVNSNGFTYVAYLFAHNAGGFGTSGTDNVISCGSYTGNGSSTGPVINLGYEPQFVLIKNATTGGEGYNWLLFDTMREITTTNARALFPNLSDAEAASALRIGLTATGFNVTSNAGVINASGDAYIYMAIRRPMKVPTTGTSVFSPELTSVRGSFLTAPTAPDMVFSFNRNFDTPAGNTLSYSRLTGAKLLTSTTDAESSRNSNSFTDSMFFYQDFTSSPMVHHAFKRASGFFDVVCYTGNSTSGTVINHNLGVVPEIVIQKKRTGPGDGSWEFWSSAINNSQTGGMYLNTNAQYYNNDTKFASLPTATTLTLPGAPANATNNTYVAYLFASVAGVSKVGTYAGNGSSQTINCGFTAGARFVLIKRTDASGDWVVLDTARGIVSGNDPFLQLNRTDAEVTGEDIVDPANSGFIVNSTTENINASGGTYIYLAIS